MVKKIFLNAPLSTLAEQSLNSMITELVKGLGLIYYSPQEIIPPGTGMPATKILEQNIHAVEDCDIVLSVLDKPGLGVVFELAYAFALGKTIVIFRSDKQDYLGKILEGFWEKTAEEHKARTLNELREILSRLKEV